MDSPSNATRLISSSNLVLDGRMITIYRFIFQIDDPFGFADLIVAAEHSGTDIGYL